MAVISIVGHQGGRVACHVKTQNDQPVVIPTQWNIKLCESKMESMYL